MPMDKKALSETDICTKFITPAILGSGWDLKNQFRQEVYFTAGRIIINGDRSERGERKRADYILYYKGNIPIAIIEAKDNNHALALECNKHWNMAKFWIYLLFTVQMVMLLLNMTKQARSKEIEREFPLGKVFQALKNFGKDTKNGRALPKKPNVY